MERDTTTSSIPNDAPASDSSSRNMIQVPAGLLTILMASVEQLKHTVEQVQRDNTSMAFELRVLRENSGTAFYRFSELPAEIREMIWKEALRTPQIHIIEEDGISQSQVNRIMQACQESRSIGIKLQIPNISTSRAGDPLNYVNLDRNTIWTVDCHYLPGRLVLFDGTASKNLAEYQGARCSPKIRLKCLVVDVGEWEDPVVDDEGIEETGGIDMLNSFNSPTELLLVVAKPNVISTSHVIFVEPRKTPYALLPELELRESLFTAGNRSKRPKINTQWHEAARRVESILTQMKTKRGEDRKRLLDGIPPLSLMESCRSKPDADGSRWMD